MERNPCLLEIRFDTPVSKALRLTSLLVTFGFFVLKSAAFLVAWSTPYKAVVTVINAFGEANIEAAMIFILLPIVTIGLVQNLVITYRLDRTGGVGCEP